MSDDSPTNGAAQAKPKRPLSEAQREALAKGQAALAARRAERAAGVVRTSSAEVREIQQSRSSRTIDDVVARLAETDAVREVPPVAAPAAELPSVEQVAKETKLYTLGADPLPPPEDNPMLNDGVVASSDAAPDLVGIQPPKNLADLMAMVPTIGDGQYYIEVVRRAPQHYGGSICKGTQRPIKEYMTDTDFVSFYGGGDYTLTLYGPPPRGGTIDARTGRPRSKALSPPVKLEISPSIYPPNVQAAVLHDDEMHASEGEETAMRYFQPGFSGGGGSMPQRPPTSADARLLEVQYEHEEKMRDREEQREKDRRAEQAQVSASLGPMLDVVHRNTLESVKVVERTAQERARLAEQQAARAEQDRIRAEERAEQAAREARMQIERERNKPTDTQQMLTGVSSLVQALRPSDASASASAEAKAATQALDQARQEIQRLTKAHADELARIQTTHAETLRRAQDDHRSEMTRRQDQERSETERLQRQHSEEMKRQEERLKENVERAERRAEEAERKADQRVQEAETRAERRINELREEHRRAVEDLRTQSQQRLDDERRQHDRDLKQQAATFETRLAGQKDMYENRMSTVSAEVTRINAEADRWRKEAEDNKDLSKQIEKAERAAAALGWAPNQGAPEEPPPPKDWKEMLGRIGMDLVGKLPEIVQSAGETVTKLRGTPGPTPQQVQQMQYDAMVAGAQQGMSRQLASMSSAPLPPPMRTASGAVFHAQPPLRFGTEDSAQPLDPSAPSPRGHAFDFDSAPAFQQPAPQQTYQPQASYQPAPQQTYQQPAPQQTYQPQAAPQQTYQQQTYQPQAASQQAALPAPAASAEPAIPQAPPGAVPAVIPPEMITQFAPVLEQALASGEPTESIAQELMGLLGRGNLAAVVNGLKPERVVVELQKAGRGSSSLVRRQGQQFLRELWAACGALLAQG